jgi:YidC/Oxa1 family membrane protein insertase
MKTGNILLFILGILVLVTLAGCFPTGPQALPPSDLELLKADLEKIDAISSEAEVKQKVDDLELEEEKLNSKDPRKDHQRLLIAYYYERLGRYEKALDAYQQLMRSHYRTMAGFRIGEVSANAPEIFEADKRALKGYTGASGYYPVGKILVRYPALASQPLEQWRIEELRTAANRRADRYQSRATSYKAIDTLVGFLGRNRRYSYGLAILLIAAFVKVITTPLTNRQIKNMREMQALQPLISELQRKFKNDRDAMMRAQMKLFKEHKVNPMGGCLPILVQMPFLIWVYRAVWAYNWQFEGTSFLWILNLAKPDTPLLILYAVSLFFSQKLTTPPTADPQQQQMQRMMAYIFPIMFLFLFKFMPAAFILYWFAQNVFMTAHQYYKMRTPPAPAAAEAQQAEKAEKKKPGKKK